MPKTLEYANLERFLFQLGFSKHRASNEDRVVIVFRHAPSGAEVYLKEYQATDALEPFNLVAVRSTLDRYGVLDREEFDKVFENACAATKAGS